MRNLYEVFLGVSIMAFAGDCEDMMVFLLWHAFWAVIGLFCAQKLVEVSNE